MLSAITLAKFPNLTFEDLMGASEKCLSKYDGYSSVLKCSPEAYIAIKDLCIEYDAEIEEHKYIKKENMKLRGELYEEPKNNWGTLFGIEIKLDPALKPGEWKFE